jgi:putative DNA primase/helicase
MATLASALPHPGSGETAPDDPSADALARRFTDRWAASARYVAAWDRWLVYDGVTWQPDVTLRVLAAARGTCRAAAEEIDDARVRARLGSVAAVAAVERLARLDRRHLATAAQWDADPWLLNTPGGTVDLRDGELRPHKGEDYITRTTAVAPGGDCEQFRAVLHRIFAGDAALIGFVQRALGSALAGPVHLAAAEPALFLACGPGASGKSLLLDTAVAILGGYAAAAALEALGPALRQRHDDTRLARARLIVATEATDRCWDAGAIATLAGGAPIGAPTAPADHGARPPGFKLFIAGNAPALRGVDAAVRRRIKLIPFGVTIPEDEADRELPRKLQEEWPGILAWMIAGCRDWQRSGLAPPPAVVAASAAYLAQEDSFGDWLEECTRKDPAQSEAAGDLYASWSRYAASRAESPGSQKAFARVLQARGFALCRVGKAGTRGYAGIRLCDGTHTRPMADALAKWGRKYGL